MIQGIVLISSGRSLRSSFRTCIASVRIGGERQRKDCNNISQLGGREWDELDLEEMPSIGRAPSRESTLIGLVDPKITPRNAELPKYASSFGKVLRGKTDSGGWVWGQSAKVSERTFRKIP